MPIISGERLYEFSNAFWNTCFSTPEWICEDLFILNAIPADKQTKFVNLDLSYSKNPDEKTILILDNSSFWKQNGFAFSTHHLWGESNLRFQYYNQEVDSINITGIPDTPEFGGIVINDHQFGKLTTKKVQSLVALREYFRKLTVSDLSINVPLIQGIIEPKLSSHFLLELSKIGTAYGVLSHLRDDFINGEEIVEDFGAVVLTNFRIIPKTLILTVRYEEISGVTLEAPVAKEKHHMHFHPPHKLDLLHVGISLISAYAQIKGASSENDKKYTLNFLVDGQKKLWVYSPSQYYLLKICDVLKRFNIKGQMPAG